MNSIRVVTVGWSTIRGVWGQSPHQPPEANGDSGVESPTSRRFSVFSSKNTHF